MAAEETLSGCSISILASSPAFGIGRHTQVWAGESWLTASMSHRVARQERQEQPTGAPASDKPDSGETQSPHVTWMLTTREGVAVEASPHQLLLGRTRRRSGWFRMADLAPGDAVGLVTDPLPAEIGGDLLRAVLGPVHFKDEMREHDAYAPGVLLNARPSGRRDPLWFARAEPVMLERLRRWAQGHGLPVGSDERASRDRGEFVARRNFVPAIRSGLPSLVRQGSLEVVASYV